MMAQLNECLSFSPAQSSSEFREGASKLDCLLCISKCPADCLQKKLFFHCPPPMKELLIKSRTRLYKKNWKFYFLPCNSEYPRLQLTLNNFPHFTLWISNIFTFPHAIALIWQFSFFPLFLQKAISLDTGFDKLHSALHRNLSSTCPRYIVCTFFQ